MNTIGIIDFKIGNIKSILQVFQKISLDFKVSIIRKSSDFKGVDRLILPGQGSVFSCINYLKSFNLIDKLFIFSKKNPILGICVGKHIFFSKSAEGNCYGLNFFSGFVEKFSSLKLKSLLKIPHIGWNKVKFINNHILFFNISNLSFFYFAHSYYTLPFDIRYVYGVTKYDHNFSSILIKNNVLLTQFHPEKSYTAGLKLCKNFSLWKP